MYDGERSGCGGGGILEGEDFQKILPHFKEITETGNLG